VNIANSDDLLAVKNEPIAMIDLSRHWLNGVRTFKIDSFSVRIPRSTGPPLSPVVMVMRKVVLSAVNRLLQPITYSRV